MDAKQFLSEFGHIANAPGGVQRLRQMILHLAVRGKLADYSYEWKEITLNELGDWANGNGFPKNMQGRNKGEILFAKVSDMNLPENSKYIYLTKNTITKEIAQELRVNVHQAGTVVFPKIGGAISTNKRRILTKPTAIDNNCIGILPHQNVSTEWLYLLLSSIDFALYQSGTSVPALSQKTISQIPTRLPRLDEQKRIVTKVEELMALCDKLEAQQQKRRKLQTLTRTIALDALANAQSAPELKTAWQRVQEHLPLLMDRPEDALELKKTIYELAILGKLSKDSDEDVGSYIGELRKTKKGKRTAKILKAQNDSKLPRGWKWVLLEDLLYSSDAGWSPKCESFPRENDNWAVLKVSAVTWDEFKENENKAVPVGTTPRPETQVKPFDFLLSRANTAELVAKSVIAPSSVPSKLMMSDKIIRLNFLDEELKPWVNLVNNSKRSREYYKSHATGTSDSMRNVTRRIIHELAIPFPPKTVQKLLMEKLSLLIENCDKLREQLTKAHSTAEKLVVAAITNLTGTQIKETQTMKAPKTELVTKLQLKTSPRNKDQAPLSAILAKHNGELSAKALYNYAGIEIDGFYQQLKTEMAQGWIIEPEKAQVIEKAVPTDGTEVA